MANDSSTVDLERPILEQVGELSDYWAWVHRSQKPGRSLRIFRSGFLEPLSHIPWWLVVVVWVPVSIGLAVYALTLGGLTPRRLFWLALTGLFVWTFVEYALHRFVFHHPVSTPVGRRIHFLGHGIHHLDPWDRMRLVFPPLAAALIALPVFGLLYLSVLWTAAPLANAAALMAGLLVGYLVYDLSHYYQHHGRPRSRVGKWLKRYHLEHHHKSPEALYGVSNPLWDILLRTGRASARQLPAAQKSLR